MSFRYTSEFYDDERKKCRVVDFLAPENPTRQKAIFFVHGGGYRAGTRDGSFRGVIRSLNESGYVCASVGYRMIDSTIFDMIADVRDGYRFFLRFLKENGRPPKVAVFGTSAGAHLAGLLALAKPGECEESDTGIGDDVHPWVPPIGLALQATPVTFEPSEDDSPKRLQFREELVGKSYDEAPELYSKLSLVNYVRPDACPVFMMEAEEEHIFRTEMSMDFAQKLRDAGVRAETKMYAAEHGFIYDVIRPVQQEAVADLAAFVESL